MLRHLLMWGTAVALLGLAAGGCRRRGPDNLEQLAEARRLAEEGKTADALSEYGRLFARNPGRLPRIRLEAANLAFRSGRFGDALLFIADIPDDAPEYLDALRLRLQILGLQQKKKDIRSLLEQLWTTGRFPDWTGPLLAELDLAEGLPAQALEIYDRLISLAPDRKFDWLTGKARALRRMGRTENARNLLRRVLTEKPGCAEAVIELTAVENAEHDYDAAEAALREGLKNTQDVRVLMELGLLLLKQNRVDEAVPLLLQAARRTGVSWKRLWPLVDALLEKKDRDSLASLIQSTSKAQTADAQAIEAYARMALALLEGDMRQAADFGRQARGKMGSEVYPPLAARLALVYLKTGSIDEARRILDALPPEKRTGPLFESVLVRVSYAVGAYEECARFGRLLKRASPDLMRMVADSEGRLGNIERALNAARYWLKDATPADDALLFVVDMLSRTSVAPHDDTISGLLGALQDDELRRLLGDIVAALYRGDPRVAAELVERLPARTPALKRRKRLEQARFYLQAGAATAAAEVLKKVPETDTSPAALLCRGWLALETGDDAHARRTLEQIAPLDPRDPDVAEARRLLALLDARSGHLVRAKRALTELAPRIDVRRPRIWLDLARIEVRLGDKSAAWKAACRYTEMAPRDPRGYLVAADTAPPEQTQAVLDLIESGLRLLPETPPLTLRYAHILWLAGRRDEALRTTKRVLRLAPDDADVLLGCAWIYAAAGRIDDAEKLLARTPQDPRLESRRNLVRLMILIQQKKFNEAVQFIRSPKIRLPEDVSEIHIIEAMVLAAGGNLEAAESVCRSIVSRRPDDARAWYYLGEILMQQKRYLEACDPFRRSLNLDPDYVPALNNLAWVLCFGLNNPEEALPLAEKAAQRASTNPDILDTLATIQLRLGRVQSAWKNFQRIVALAPKPQFLVKAAEAAERAGKLDEARRLLGRARNAAANDPEFTKRVQRLEARLNQNIGTRQ